MDRVVRRGPLARALGALKGGYTSEIVNTFVAVEGGGFPLEKKQIFEKSHNAEKLEGGPFGIFKHPFCKISKKLKGKIFIFGKNSHNAEKN